MRSGLPRVWLLLPIVLIALAVGAGTSSAASPNPKTRAVVLLDNIARHRYAAVTATFTLTMRRQLNSTQLATQWRTFQQAFGRYLGRGRPVSARFGPQTVVAVPLRMARRKAEFRVTLLPNGRVIDLRFLLPGLPL